MSKTEKRIFLPNNWTLTTISEIGIVVSGGTPSTDELQFWGGDIPWITPADLSNYEDKYISKGKRNLSELGLEYSSARLLPKGTILFSSRAPIGYVAIAKNEISTNQGFKNLIITPSVNSDYVYYYLKTIKQLAEKVSSGTTFLELSAEKFGKIPFPLPPLKEQKDIASKIEELFSELDSAKESLKTCENLLHKIKKIIFKNAFSGKFSNEFHNSDISYDIKKLIVSDKELPKLPKGWIYSNLELLTINHDEKRIPLSSQQRKQIKGKYPYYGATEIIDNINEFIFDGEYLLIGEDGANLLSKTKPLAFIVNGKFWANNHVHVLQPKQHIIIKYLAYFFNTLYLAPFISGTAQPKLNKSNLNRIPIPICSLEEQMQIVKEIEYRITIIENTEKIISDNLNKIKICRYSILKKAFNGTLIFNEKENELGSELLKKIKEEKEQYFQEQIIAKKIKREPIMEELKSIIEILNEANQPVSAERIWQKSIHKNDIEAFYSELKKIENRIEVIMNDQESLIKLIK